MATYTQGAATSLPRQESSGARPPGPALTPRSAAAPRESDQGNTTLDAPRQPSIRDRVKAMAGRENIEKATKAAAIGGGGAAVDALTPHPMREGINYASDLFMMFLFAGVFIPILDQILFGAGLIWFGIRVIVGNVLGVESIALRGFRSILRNIGSINFFLWGFAKFILFTALIYLILQASQCVSSPVDCFIEGLKQFFAKLIA